MLNNIKRVSISICACVCMSACACLSVCLSVCVCVWARRSGGSEGKFFFAGVVLTIYGLDLLTVNSYT